MISLVHERSTPSFRTPGRSPTRWGTPTPGTPCRSPTRWDAPSTPSARRRETVVMGRSEGWMLRRGVNRDVTEFSTPQRVTMMGREHAVVEFRTPQHPLVGSNNWGGASPMLSRNIPKQAMDTAYLKFNNLAGESDSDYYNSDDGYDFHVRPAGARGDVPPQPHRRRGWLSSILKWKPKSKGDKVSGGPEPEEKKMKKKKSSWLPKSKPKPKKDSSGFRWPQG